VHLIKRLLLFGWLLLISPALFAQSVPAAEGPGGSVWAGVEVSSFNPDWGCKQNSPFSCWNRQLAGIAVFADANRLIGSFGMEAEARWLDWRGPGGGIEESNYMAGPRYQLIAHPRLSFNAKVLAGMSNFHRTSQSGAWATFAPGVTLGYRLTPRVMLRGDYEYQIWPGFTPRGLTPNGFSVGASYRFLH
jgi:hypothetical protein